MYLAERVADRELDARVARRLAVQRDRVVLDVRLLVLADDEPKVVDLELARLDRLPLRRPRDVPDHALLLRLR
jgi:DNA-binding GntR family transcriptional regulator